MDPHKKHQEKNRDRILPIGKISGVFSLRVSLEAFLTAACRIGSGTNGEMESSVVHPHSKRHQESGCAGGY
jgi:hypothetical protein